MANPVTIKLTDSPIKYAKSSDVHIAYRIFGDGPRDIVLVPGTLPMSK